jgi:hypothetical protein
VLQILVLGFCDSQRDLEVVQKILSQVCGALSLTVRVPVCMPPQSIAASPALESLVLVTSPYGLYSSRGVFLLVMLSNQAPA